MAKIETLVTWKYIEDVELKNHHNYLVAFRGFDNPKEIEVGHFAYENGEWYDQYTYFTSDVPQLKETDVVIAVAEPPKFALQGYSSLINIVEGL